MAARPAFGINIYPLRFFVAMAVRHCARLFRSFAFVMGEERREQARWNESE